VQNTQGCGLFDGSEVGLGPVAPNDLFRHRLTV
jgi:hypothetical protein